MGGAWLAYTWYSEVPTKIIKLEQNTLVAPASMAAAYGNNSKLLNDPDAKGCANLLGLYQGYSKLGGKMGSYEYWSGNFWGGPLPLLTVMKDRLTQYRKYGVEMVYNEFHPNWGPQTIQFYFYGRLLWNPDLDLDQEMEEFCRNYYGPAAQPMVQYHRLLEKASLEGPAWFQLGVFIGNLFSNDELIERMTPLMKKARELVQGQEPYQRRLNGDWAGYEVARRFNLAMRYKRDNNPIMAISTWDDMWEFIQSDTAGEIWDGPTITKGSRKIQEREYGINAMRAQIASLKTHPGAHLLLNLDSDWKFSPDPQKSGLRQGVPKSTFGDKNWPTLNATSDWTSQGQNFHGTAWYRKKFTLDKKVDGKKYFLFFGAVDGRAVIYVNGEKAGDHLLGPNYEGYDQDFMIDITGEIQAGNNLVAVQVTKEFALAGITKGVNLMQM
jgi:hypothetical protein